MIKINSGILDSARTLVASGKVVESHGNIGYVDNDGVIRCCGLGLLWFAKHGEQQPGFSLMARVGTPGVEEDLRSDITGVGLTQMWQTFDSKRQSFGEFLDQFVGR